MYMILISGQNANLEATTQIFQQPLNEISTGKTFEYYAHDYTFISYFVFS